MQIVEGCAFCPSCMWIKPVMSEYWNRTTCLNCGTELIGGVKHTLIKDGWIDLVGVSTESGECHVISERDRRGFMDEVFSRKIIRL